MAAAPVIERNCSSVEIGITERAPSSRSRRTYRALVSRRRTAGLQVPLKLAWPILPAEFLKNFFGSLHVGSPPFPSLLAKSDLNC